MLDYQEEVRKKVSNSVLNSLVREWEGVTEEQVRCLLDDLRLTQFEKVHEDPEVKAVCEKRDVDPAVVD